MTTLRESAVPPERVEVPIRAGTRVFDGRTFRLRGEHIPLDALLKATGLAPSGGAAKAMIDTGAVQVDGMPETRRSCKLRAGQVVRVGEVEVVLLAPDPDA